MHPCMHRHTCISLRETQGGAPRATICNWHANLLVGLQTAVTTAAALAGAISRATPAGCDASQPGRCSGSQRVAAGSQHGAARQVNLVTTVRLGPSETVPIIITFRPTLPEAVRAAKWERGSARARLSGSAAKRERG